MAQIYGEAICNVARCGASRCGNYKPRVIIKLGGTDISRLVHKSSIKITDIINEQPSTASFEIRLGSITPLEGNSLTIYLGTTQHPIFGGRIMSTDLDLPRQAQRYPRMTLNCVDATWDIDTLAWTPLTAVDAVESTSASSLVMMLLDQTEATYTVDSIEPDMPVIPSFRVSLDEPFSSQITRLMRTIGGWWFVDADRVTHAFVTASSFDKTPLAVTDSSPFWGFKRHRDISQMRTSYNVFGGSGAVLSVQSVSVSRSAIFMDSVSYYSSDLIDHSRFLIVTDTAGGVLAVQNWGDGSLVRSINVASTALMSDLTPDLLALKKIVAGVKLRVWADDGIVDAPSAQSVTTDRMGLSKIVSNIDDDTLGQDAAEFVGEAQLATFDDVEDTITYVTRDKWTVSGKVASLSISSPVAMSGTYVVQRVEMSHFDEADTKGPQRSATLGTNKRDLNDLLRRLIQGRGRG
jgi:hypothetical protein